MTLSFSFSGGFNGVPTFPAASARAQLVLPDPISALCVPAGHVVSSPLHDCGTERDLAWKVRCDVGVTGKVVPVKVPNVVRGGRARSAGCQRCWPGRELARCQRSQQKSRCWSRGSRAKESSALLEDGARLQWLVSCAWTLYGTRLRPQMA